MLVNGEGERRDGKEGETIRLTYMVSAGWIWIEKRGLNGFIQWLG